MFVLLAAMHGLAIVVVPSAPLLAIGMWWNSNTIAHNWIHHRFFRSRRLDRIFSAYQSVLLGIPQVLYRERHVAHHAGVRWRLRLSRRLVMEGALVAGLWSVLALAAPSFFVFTYLPGYLAGLALCSLQGHFEHARGTTSHYGRLYNRLLFNDGYHVEHHAAPGRPWFALPSTRHPAARVSRWPAPLRWLDVIDLDALEQLVLRVRPLQRLVVAAHRRAFAAALDGRADAIARAAIVGGGLFPRSALVLHEIAPAAEIVLIDANAAHLAAARTFLERQGGDLRTRVTFRHECYTGTRIDADLVVIPLAYRGDRAAIYARPPAPLVIVHDWIWRRRGEGWVVASWLLKRINLVRP